MPRPVLPPSQAAGLVIRYPLKPYARGLDTVIFPKWSKLECAHLRASRFVRHLFMAQTIALVPELMPWAGTCMWIAVCLQALMDPAFWKAGE